MEGGQVGERHSQKRQTRKLGLQRGKGEGRGPGGLPSPRFMELPQGQWGQIENETPRPRTQGCDPQHRRITEASKRKWEGTRSRGAKHKLVLPPAPSQRDRAAAEPSAATERQCPLVAMLTQQQQRSGKVGGRCTGFGRERRQVR